MERQGRWSREAVVPLRVLLVALLAWLAYDALEPGLHQEWWQVVGSYFALGLVATLAFPRATWIGIFVALACSVLIELLQAFVPVRDVQATEIVAKWGSSTAGVATALVSMFVLQKRTGRLND